MLEKWKETGLDKLILKAYEDGKIICGLSAGAICWFTNMYTDYEIMRGQSADYVMKKGLGVLDGTMCPHFNERKDDFLSAMKERGIEKAYCVENDSALVFVNGTLTKTLSSGGQSYIAENKNGEITLSEINE